jgi:P22 coat protein - gene protein 5
LPAITSVNVANAIVKLVAADALPALVGNLVLGNLVNRDYEPTLAQAGDTINIPIPPTMVANNIAEGGTVQTQNPNLGNAQIVINTHAEATFQIPDVTKVLAVPNLMMVYMQPAIIAVAESIETAIANLYPLLTALAPTGSASTADEARFDVAETELFAAKVPRNEQRILVVSGNAYSQMRQIPRFSEYQTVGPAVDGSPMVTGKLPGTNAPNGTAEGEIKGFNVYRSQYVQNVGGTTFNMAFTKSAIGLVMRRLPQPLPGTGAIAEYAEMGNFGIRITMSYQPNTLAQQFTVDVLYGVAILRNNFGLIVKTN